MYSNTQDMSYLVYFSGNNWRKDDRSQGEVFNKKIIAQLTNTKNEWMVVKDRKSHSAGRVEMTVRIRMEWEEQT